MKNKELETIIENEFDCLINDLGCLIGEEWKAECVKEVANKAFALGLVSQQRELLPKFLMKDLDGKIVTAYIGGADVTKEWNEYLGNCG